MLKLIEKLVIGKVIKKLIGNLVRRKERVIEVVDSG